MEAIKMKKHFFFLISIYFLLFSDINVKSYNFDFQEIENDNKRFTSYIYKYEDSYYFSFYNEQGTEIALSDYLTGPYNTIGSIEGHITSIIDYENAIYIVSQKQVGFTINSFFYRYDNNKIEIITEIPSALISQLIVFNDTLFLLGISVTSGSATKGKIFKFTNQNNEVERIDFSYHPIMSANIYNDELYVLTISGNIYKTKGVHLWDAVLEKNNWSNTYVKIKFFDDIGFVCAQNSNLLSSHNNWENIFYLESDIKLWDIEQISDGVFLLAGENSAEKGIVYITTDNATSFQKLEEFEFPVRNIYIENEKVLLITKKEKSYISEIITGIKDSNNELSISYYDGILYFNDYNLRETNIKIFNYIGQKIYSETINSNQIALDLKKGIYFVHINNNITDEIHKVVVEE
jgi:hypothetical protein